jgi:O-antigen/teichoic acid export membrane protein
MIGKLKKQVVKNFFWALAGRIFAAGIQTIGIILLARWESVENFGVVVSILALSVLLHAIIDFGLSPFLIKEYAKTHNEQLASECIILNAKAANIFSFLSMILLVILGMLLDSLYYSLIPLSIWVAFERRADLLLGLYIAEGNNKKATQFLLIRRFLFIISFVFLYLILNIGATLAYSMGIAMAAILSYIQVSKQFNFKIIEWSNDKNWNILKQSFPFWINSLFAQLRNIDVLVVTLILGSVQGAYFGFVNRSIAPLNMISTSMASVILPSVSKKEIEEHEFLKYIFFITLVASVPYFLVYFFVDSLIPMFLGNNYFATIELIKIVCIGLVFFSASSIINSILQGIDMQKHVAYANFFATLIYFVILLIMTNIGGVVFSAYALVVFFLLRFLLTLRLLYKYFLKGKTNG